MARARGDDDDRPPSRTFDALSYVELDCVLAHARSVHATAAVALVCRRLRNGIYHWHDAQMLRSSRTMPVPPRHFALMVAYFGAHYDGRRHWPHGLVRDAARAGNIGALLALGCGMDNMRQLHQYGSAMTIARRREHLFAACRRGSGAAWLVLANAHPYSLLGVELTRQATRYGDPDACLRYARMLASFDHTSRGGNVALRSRARVRRQARPAMAMHVRGLVLAARSAWSTSVCQPLDKAAELCAQLVGADHAGADVYRELRRLVTRARRNAAMRRLQCDRLVDDVDADDEALAIDAQRCVGGGEPVAAATAGNDAGDDDEDDDARTAPPIPLPSIMRVPVWVPWRSVALSRADFDLATRLGTLHACERDACAPWPTERERCDALLGMVDRAFASAALSAV